MSDTLRRTLGESIAIETVLADGLWPVSVDANQLESALLNLAVNARDAMPGQAASSPSRPATLPSTRCTAVSNKGVAPGQYVMLAISDTGVGMTPDVVAQGIRAVLHDQGHRCKAPGSACRRSTASSSSQAATSTSTASRGADDDQNLPAAAGGWRTDRT